MNKEQHISDKQYDEAMRSMIDFYEKEAKILTDNIEIVKTKIDYPFECIEGYLTEGINYHLGYVRVFEEKEYKNCFYPSHKHYSVIEKDNQNLSPRISKYLMRQDDNKDNSFHCLVWQTTSGMGEDNYAGFILFPLTDGTYWALSFEL